MKKKPTKTTKKSTAKDLSLPAEKGNKIKGGMGLGISPNMTPPPSHR